MQFSQLVNLLKLSFFALCLCSSKTFSHEVSAETFLSAETSDFPEVNLLVFNNSNKEQSVTIAIQPEPIPPNTDCQEVPDIDWKNHSINRPTVANAFDDSFTHALIPPSGWIHRAYRAGAHVNQYPCAIRYNIQYKEKGGNFESITGAVNLTKAIPPSYPFSGGKTGDFTISYSVEEDIDKSTTLARILIKNTSRHELSLYLSRRQLKNCNTGFDYRYPYKQGMDGQIQIEKNSYGIAVIPVIFNESTRQCSLELDISSLERGSRGEVLKTLSIPFNKASTYQFLYLK